MRAADPFGQFLKFFQINVFALVLDLLFVVFITEMPNCKSDWCRNNQNNEIPKTRR